MFDKEITFDRFIRGVITLSCVAGGVWVVNRLSDVLLPFLVAWLLAYLIYPLVHFIQYRLHLRYRVPSIIVALVLVLAFIAGMVALIVPAAIQEFMQVKDVLVKYVEEVGGASIAEQTSGFIRQYFENNTFMRLLQEKSFMQLIQVAVGEVWSLVSSVISMLWAVFGAAIVVLYTIFILFDYERIGRGALHLVPRAQRRFAAMVMSDVAQGMNAYFRGQALIAFLVGVLFSLGFLIIGFPLAIGLGMFIGCLNLVPYLQTLGFIPTLLLALMKSAQTGENFLWVLLPALGVFVVVQAIQDMLLTPRIMGKAMGLNPAVILLSLSVWGSLLGLVGLIIALPLTTLILSYYKRFVLEEAPKR